MKKLILIAALSLTTLTGAFAQTLEAKSLKTLVQRILDTDFTYRDRGMVFGFDTIQSCLFVGKDIAVIKNYCFPVKVYPARGYTIISREFGMIDIYEETLPSVIKRDFQITHFPEILAPYLTTNPEDQNIRGLSDIIAKMHPLYLPACWSSNFSWYTEGIATGCNVPVESVVGYEQWKTDAESIETTDANWNFMMKEFEKRFTLP